MSGSIFRISQRGHGSEKDFQACSLQNESLLFSYNKKSQDAISKSKIM